MEKRGRRGPHDMGTGVLYVRGKDVGGSSVEYQKKKIEEGVAVSTRRDGGKGVKECSTGEIKLARVQLESLLMSKEPRLRIVNSGKELERFTILWVQEKAIEIRRVTQKPLPRPENHESIGGGCFRKKELGTRFTKIKM